MNYHCEDAVEVYFLPLRELVAQVHERDMYVFSCDKLKDITISSYFLRRVILQCTGN